MHDAQMCCQTRGYSVAYGMNIALAQCNMQALASTQPPSSGNPSRSGWAAHGDLVQALYSMADRYLVFARELLLESPALPQVIRGTHSAPDNVAYSVAQTCCGSAACHQQSYRYCF
jgi:hypothetical protein